MQLAARCNVTRAKSSKRHPGEVNMHRSLARSFVPEFSAMLGLILLSATQLLGQASVPPLAKFPLPPLAWSSWNSFSNTVDSNVTMAQAQALVHEGLHNVGYEYVNIDEGWGGGDRDAAGIFVIARRGGPAISAGDKPGDMANI